MKLDFVIGNPPYDGRNYLYTKILYEAWNNSNAISWLCPTTFVDDIYKRNSVFNKVIYNFEKYLDGFEDVDPSGFDMLVAQDSLGVFYFDHNCIMPVDMYNLAWRKFDSPAETEEICKKILDYCKKSSLKEHILSPKKVKGSSIIKNETFKCDPTKWYVGTSWVRGTIGDWTWVCLFGNKDIPIKGNIRDSWFHVWEFNDENMAINFSKYIRNSKILRFAIHMEKKNQTNNYSDFGYFPYATIPWDDRSLQKQIGLTNKEMELIDKVVSIYKFNT